VDSTDDNYLETRCIGLQGTHCVSGSGIGVVVSTGDSTVFGKIAKMTNAPKTGMTTLEREVLNFVIVICSIMFSMIIVVIIVWYEPISKRRRRILTCLGPLIYENNTQTGSTFQL
jgi:sodium/potassium-transporting ATPase subunit alpha